MQSRSVLSFGLVALLAVGCASDPISLGGSGTLSDAAQDDAAANRSPEDGAEAADAIAPTDAQAGQDGQDGQAPAEIAAAKADADSKSSDHCSGAKQGDGTYCANSFAPIPSDAADFANVLFTCAGGVTLKYVTCAAGCKAISPGKDSCGIAIPVCGDGQCQSGETCSQCAKDCGACAPVCGDGQCNNGETCGSCAKDCGACPPVCGDGKCEAGETCSACEKDCGACPPSCGDGACNGDEKCTTCAKDCGACPVADPCVGATSGNGAYCSDSLKPVSPQAETLYICKDKKTSSAQKCAYGCFIAPSGVPDYCKPPPSGNPGKGKGVWVWMFNTTAESPAAVATEMQKLGMGFILIKSGQDTDTYDSNFNADVVKEFTSRGIDVYGWPYVKPGDNDAKATAIAKSAKIPGVKGIILDVEGEYVKHDVDALELCDKIRQKAPGVFLGYTSYGWVMYHTDFPYEAFDQACGDAFLPQTYWDLWSTGPEGGYQKAIDGVQKLKLKAPVWAAQDNYNGATVADMDKFFAVAGPHASLWRWPNPKDSAIHAKMVQVKWSN